MRSFFLMAALAAVLVFGSAPVESVAQPPDRIDSYRILPRLSVLGESGGFAGGASRYRLSGGFDLVQQFETSPFGGFVQTAGFDNAEVWGSRIAPDDVILPAVVIDVDRRLNMEGLSGSLLPLGAPFDAYHFQGQMADGSDVDLFAALFGPWMYMVGGTTPPPGSADFFEYDVRILARTRPWADRNDDGRVDGADYTMMRDQAALSAASATADTGATLADWREQYGETLPDLAALDAAFGVSSFATAVPEPGACFLAFLAVTAAASRRRSD